jgi:hypothetical protein
MCFIHDPWRKFIDIPAIDKGCRKINIVIRLVRIYLDPIRSARKVYLISKEKAKNEKGNKKQ